MSHSPKMTMNEYYFSLSDGNAWRIAGESNAQWVDILAKIMEMEECPQESRLNSSPSIVFHTIGTSKDSARQPLTYSTARLFVVGCNTRGSGFYRDSLRVRYPNNTPDVSSEINNNEGAEIQIISMYYALLPIYQRSICLGGLPFHAGLVELGERGVLLAGLGDTGKSTCCRRLPDYWRPLCDDETLVVHSLTKQQKYRAHPFPTLSDCLRNPPDKTWNVQYSVPLSAAFFLEQSATDAVIPVGEREAAILMYESASQVFQKLWNSLDGEYQRQLRKDLFINACEMAKEIPAYYLRISLHGRFWEKMEHVLGW